jgi:hypothetical protein
MGGPVTRRAFIPVASAAIAPSPSQGPLLVPVRLVIDTDAQWSPAQIQNFWSHIWPEAVRDLNRCGVRLQPTVQTGRVERPPHREPVVTGLERGVINLALTDRIPWEWDKGRAVSGVATIYRGFHLCMIAINRAHGHQIPLLSVNTCVHELLHALLNDVFESRPHGWFGEAREFRIDWYATRLWLFRDGAAIRQAAGSYVQRLRSDPAAFTSRPPRITAGTETAHTHPDAA